MAYVRRLPHAAREAHDAEQDVAPAIAAVADRTPRLELTWYSPFDDS